MKLRLHVLFLFIATTAATMLAGWMALPIWKAEGYDSVSYAGKNDESSELYSLSSVNWQASWFMETQDWRSGQLLRKLPLEVPRRTSHSHNLNAPSEGDGSDAILLLTQHTFSNQFGPSVFCLLLDGSSGKLLPHAPIQEMCFNGQLARHKNQLALALTSEVRLFRDKHDAGRSIALLGVSKVAFSPDGSTLACRCGDHSLFLVDIPSGEVIKPAGIDLKLIDVSFERNGQLLLASLKPNSGSVSQDGVQITRWKREGSTVRQVGPIAVLRCNEMIGMPLPIHFEERGFNSLHIKLFQGSDWPHGLDHVFSWLTQKGIAVEKWYPKKSYTQCFELNSSNQVVSTYVEWNDGRFKLSDGVAVSYLPDWQQANRIAVYRIRRVWPWALSVGIVVYAGLWRAVRWKKSKQTV